MPPSITNALPALSLVTFAAPIADVCESLHRTGFRRMLMISGRGDNRASLTAVCPELTCRRHRRQLGAAFCAAR
jgi:creatinine amidohydrolase/Fe(II)-dependent formamide hydrolase-like protein